MKVNDFSRKLGIPSSKVRYYDRQGLIQGSRGDNNYRSFNEEDALMIYNVQMLRSFGMSIEESMQAKAQSIAEITKWVGNHQQEMEEQVRQLEMKRYRLSEMKCYFEGIEKKKGKIEYASLEDSYNIFSFGKKVCLNSDEIQIINRLSEVMPYSYIVIKISKESVECEEGPLEVSIGLGILRSNQEKLGITMPLSVQKTEGRERRQILLEVKDPMNLTRDDLRPVLEDLKRTNSELQDDLMGRIYLSYMKDGQCVHGLGLGYKTK